MHFTVHYIKESTKEFSGWTRVQNLMESSMAVPKLKDYNFLLQWIRVGPYLLKVHRDPQKQTLPLRQRLWIQKLSRFLSFHHKPKFQKKMLDRYDFKKKSKTKNSKFLSNLYSKPLLKYSNPKFKKYRQSLHLEFWVSLQEGLKATVYRGNSWKCCNFFKKTSTIHNEEWAEKQYP